MKNFLLADSSELFAVRLISASWAQKRLIPSFCTCSASSSWKIFFSPIRARYLLLDSFRPTEPKNVWFQVFTNVLRRVHEKFSSPRFEQLMAVRLLSPKTFESYFLDMRYVEFMKNFLLADSSKLMAVRLISATLAQKRLIPTFYTWCTSSSWKIFYSPIRASSWLLDSFRSPEPQNVWILLSKHVVRRVHEKFSSRRFEQLMAVRHLSPKTFESYFLDMMYVEFMKNFPLADSSKLMLLDSFRPPEPQNVWILLSKHVVRRVHEKFSSRRFEQLMAVRLLSPKTFESYFLDMMYVEFMKNFLLADSSKLIAVRVISASWTQKRLIPNF